MSFDSRTDPTALTNLPVHEGLGLFDGIGAIPRNRNLHNANIRAIGNRLAAEEAGYGKQATPETDPADVAGLTVDQMLSGILVCTPTGTVNYQPPNGTDLIAALPTTFAIDDTFDLTLINLGGAGDIITMVVETGITYVGSVTVDDAGADINSSGTFRFRYTAANTFIAYRVA